MENLAYAKALTFIDVCKQTIQHNIILGMDYEFYNQSFYMEMLTKYFFGFEKVSTYHYYNKYENIEISFIENINENDNITSMYSIYETNQLNNKQIDFIFPNTLNDFINDINRFGKNIYWNNSFKIKWN